METETMEKQSAISVRIPASIKKAIDKAADKDRRSTSSLVQLILEDWLKQQRETSDVRP
jgi:hypothetical protein